MQVQEFVSRLYHFIARGNDRQPIFLAESDRRTFERFLSDGVERRYRASLIRTDAALQALVLYIHLNPVRAADNIARRLATDPALQDLLTEIERSLSLRRD